MSGRTSSRGPEKESLAGKLTQPSIKLVIALVVLFVAQLIVESVGATKNTMLDLPRTETQISVAQLLVSIFTIIMFISVMVYAFKVGGILAREMPEFPKIRRIIQLIGVMIVLVWAYGSFRWLVGDDHYPQYNEYYDIGFLVVGILFVFWLGLVLYLNVDNIARLISSKEETE